MPSREADGLWTAGRVHDPWSAVGQVMPLMYPLVESADTDARVLRGVQRYYGWRPFGWRFLLEARSAGVSLHPEVRDAIARKFIDAIPAVSASLDRVYLGCVIERSARSEALKESRRITSIVLEMAGLEPHHVTSSCMYNIREVLADLDSQAPPNVISLDQYRQRRALT